MRIPDWDKSSHEWADMNKLLAWRPFPRRNFEVTNTSVGIRLG